MDSSEGGLEPTQRMRAVLHVLMLAPAPDGVDRHLVFGRQCSLGLVGLLGGLADFGCGGGVLMRIDVHAGPSSRSSAIAGMSKTESSSNWRLKYSEPEIDSENQHFGP